MDSGFNHISITIGDDIELGEPYDISEQVSENIFINNKLLYCNITLPDTIALMLGSNTLTSIMFRIGNFIYGTSLSFVYEGGYSILNLALSNLQGRIYFNFNFINY